MRLYIRIVATNFGTYDHKYWQLWGQVWKALKFGFKIYFLGRLSKVISAIRQFGHLANSSTTLHLFRVSKNHLTSATWSGWTTTYDLHFWRSKITKITLRFVKTNFENWKCQSVIIAAKHLNFIQNFPSKMPFSPILNSKHSQFFLIVNLRCIYIYILHIKNSHLSVFVNKFFELITVT